jgi:hypothetical protein
MRCLSVRQPWASLIASGRKTIELRSRRTHYRGPLIICAASRPWDGEHDFELGPMGVCVALVELVDCRPATPSDADAACVAPPEGWWAWKLRLVRRLPEIPVKGALGLFMPPPSVVTAVAA